MRRGLVTSGLTGTIFLVMASLAAADQTPSVLLRTTATTTSVTLPRLSLSASLGLTWLREPGPVGVNLRLRLAMPIAPYIEGRLGDGVSAARPDGALMIPGTPVGLSGSACGGWTYNRGVDLGLDVRRFRGGYVSVALGWLRSSWPVAASDERGNFLSRFLTSDGFVFKLGVSF